MTERKSMLRMLTKALMDPGPSFLLYVAKATIMMEAPGWCFSGILMIGQFFGWYYPDIRPSPFINWHFGIVVLVGPVLETIVLAGVAWLLGKVFVNTVVISVISGIAWGTLHAWGAPNQLEYVLTLFWSGYDFFIFTMAYHAWKTRCLWHGILAAMLPHLAHDGQWKLLTLIS